MADDEYCMPPVEVRSILKPTGDDIAEIRKANPDWVLLGPSRLSPYWSAERRLRPPKGEGPDVRDELGGRDLGELVRKIAAFEQAEREQAEREQTEREQTEREQDAGE